VFDRSRSLLVVGRDIAAHDLQTICRQQIVDMNEGIFQPLSKGAAFPRKLTRIKIAVLEHPLS
jgi:hypothetical protein